MLNNRLRCTLREQGDVTQRNFLNVENAENLKTGETGAGEYHRRQAGQGLTV